MKTFLATLVTTLSLFALSPTASFQDPVVPKKDNIYVEFVTDCNWLVWDLTGKIKLKADNIATNGGRVSFRAWEPNRQLGTQEFRGMIIYTDLAYTWARDYLVFNNSAYIMEFPDLNQWGHLPGWHYGIHFNRGGTGLPNAGAIMRVWGPCQFIRLYHGEAIVHHGDTVKYVKVDENDYLNFPVWEISLR